MKKNTIPMARARVAVNINGSIDTTKNLFTTIAAPEINAVIKISIVPHNSLELLALFFIILVKVIMYLKFPSIIKI